MPAEDAATFDLDTQVLLEMLAVHTLQRRIYRRFVYTISLAFAGFASCLAGRAAHAKEAGDSITVVALLSIAATIMAWLDARDVRALTARIQRMSGTLRSRDLRHR